MAMPNEHVEVKRSRAERLMALVCALLVAPATLAVLAGAPAWMPGIPLLLVGLVLVFWSTQWALCFIAFSITPFCIVQHEFASITFNLPEVLILLLAVREGWGMIVRRESFAPRLPLVPLTLFVTSLLVALGTGLLRQNGAVAVLQDFRQFSEFIVLFWLVVQCVRTREQAGLIALCFVLGSALIAMHGIVQQFTFVGISAKQIASDFVLHKGVRSGSFYGATALGGMMVLACGPAMGVLLTARRRWVQALVVMCIVLCLFAVVFTKTRGSWLGLGVALTYMALSVRPTKRLLAGALVVAGVFALLLGPMIVSRMATLADPSHDQSLMDRAQYYTAAYQIGRAHPLLGLGWGCYYDIREILKNEGYIRVPRPDPETLAARLASDEGVAEVTVHSAYLQVFVKTGFLGVAGLFAVILAWMERAWRARHARSDEEHGWALYAGITAGLAGYLFHSTFENFFQWPVMAQSFWLLMGLSFALAPSESRTVSYRVPAAALALGAVVFAIFMYVCIQLERMHTDNFEQNVARALGEGNVEKALLIARRAVEVEIDKPLPKVVYGRVLLEAGQTEAGLSQLRQAAGEVLKPGAPPNQNTGADSYFAPARLSLGRYYAGRGDVSEALAQFELARAGADLSDSTFAEFHGELYDTYARRGRWARALDFGFPDEASLATLPGWSLVQIGHSLLDRQRWDDLANVTTVLRTRGEFPTEVAWLAGRSLLAQSKGEMAAPSFALAKGINHADYFLGVALESAGRTEEAVDAYRSLSEVDVLRSVGLLRAAALIQDPVQREHLVAQGQALINQWQAVHFPGEGRYRVLACGRNPGDAAVANKVPLVVVWEDREIKGASVTGLVVAPGADDSVTVALPEDGKIVTLQWVENRVAWESLENAYPGDTVLPGWIDCGRDWFHLRTGPGFSVERAPEGDASLKLSSLSWVYSTPVQIEPESTWLITGHLRDPGDNAVFHWQVVDRDNNVLAEAKEEGATDTYGWRERADAVVAGEGAVGLRVTFQTEWPVHESAELDDTAVYPLLPPVFPAHE